jgi:thiaminase/transcriptional activator TenA
MNFSLNAWDQARPIIKKIEAHPFNQQLSNGTLDNDIFLYYLAQDSVYLESYLKAFCYILAKIDKPYQSTFHRYIESIIVFEKQEINKLFILPDHLKNTVKPTLATVAYTNYLIKIACVESAAVATAAIVPCFWIYNHLASLHLKNVIQTNPFKPWIDLYSSAYFNQSTLEIIAIMNDLASRANSVEQTKMLEAFHMASCLEWHFWDDAYHQNTIDQDVSASFPKQFS